MTLLHLNSSVKADWKLQYSFTLKSHSAEAAWNSQPFPDLWTY